jgi:hypothetical protein
MEVGVQRGGHHGATRRAAAVVLPEAAHMLANEERRGVFAAYRGRTGKRPSVRNKKRVTRRRSSNDYV